MKQRPVSHTVKKGDRIAQLICEKISIPEIKEVEVRIIRRIKTLKPYHHLHQHNP